jgi:hypothetical protein
LKNCERVFSRTIAWRQPTIRELACGQRICRRYDEYLNYHESVIFSISRVGCLRWQPSSGPVRTARNVAKNTAITVKNVAHSVVKAQGELCTR